MHREQFGRVGDSRMSADGGPCLSLTEQELSLRIVGIVIVDTDHRDAEARPFAIEPLGDLRLRLLALSMIGNKANRLETRGFQAACDAPEHLGEGGFGNS